ncbi:MAG TPA: hypothetical protein DCZ94_17960 [Lentisphaeria bacterium]|nr:MAG: hypothetical protein A2X48_20675 [Lentisphaerae bacterium GWF2_49_21]HBC88832.1 hypothetical protein [Lentisphaeria bacterium]
MFVKRKVDTENLLHLIKKYPITFLAGPRRCGKSTLAKSIDHSRFYSLSDSREADIFIDFCKKQPRTKGVVVVDEIQSCPDSLPFIRQWIDARPTTKLLLLGSAPYIAGNNLNRQLCGRMAVYQIGGFTLQDIGMENISRHWLRGGFPESYLAQNEEDSFAWRKEYISAYPHTVLERESTGLSQHVIESLIRSSPRYTGRMLSFSNLSHNLGVPIVTLQQYFNLLSASGIVRLINPFVKSASTTLRKLPKLYMRDSGLLTCLSCVKSEESLEKHELAPFIWESYIMESMALSLSHKHIDISYWTDRTGNEIDAVWKEKDHFFGINIKYNPKPHIKECMIEKAINTIGLSHLWVLSRGNETLKLSNNTTVIPIKKFLSGQMKPGSSTAASNKLPKLSLKAKQVFISYCHRDDIFVNKLVPILESSKINVIIDHKTLRLGDKIEEFIKKAVRNTEWTILIVSENSIKSPWVMAEFLETVFFEKFTNQSRLIPICLDKSIFNPDLPIEIDKELEIKIAEVDDRIRTALDRKMGLDPFVNVRDRLRILQFNVGKAVERLSSVLMGDFSDPKLFNHEIKKILNALQK